jgi:hypothetical protein
MGQRKTRKQAYDNLILKMLIYGQGGSGKTRFIRTFDDDPRTARVLILSYAGNPVSIMLEDPEPFVIECDTPEDTNLPWQFLVAGQPEKHRFRDAYEVPKDMIFRTVAIDTLTELQRQVNARIAGVSQTPAGWNKMRIQDWGESFGHMLNIARLFYTNLTECKRPVHVIMSVQERSEMDSENKVEKISVALQGQAKDTVHQYAELGARLAQRTIAKPGQEPTIGTVAFFSVMGKVWAKNQLAMSLGNDMAFPTAGKILDKVMESPQWQGAVQE